MQEYMDLVHAGRELAKQITENEVKLNQILIDVQKAVGKEQLSAFLKDIDIPWVDQVGRLAVTAALESQYIGEEGEEFVTFPLTVMLEGEYDLRLLTDED